MMASRTDDERLRILGFWWMLELFSPQQVPRLTRPATRPVDRQVIRWEPGDRLPWEVLPPPKPIGTTPRVWRHTVYLGVYPVTLIHEALSQVFGDDPEAHDRGPQAESAGAGLVVDGDGQLVADSAVLSSALWATARVHSRGGEQGWAEGFPGAQAALTEAFDQAEGARRELAGDDLPPLDAEALTILLDIALQVAQVADLPDLASRVIVIDSVATSARRGADEQSDFLNSFFLGDLSAVSGHVFRGDFGAALAGYLTSDSRLPLTDRVDVVRRPDIVEAGAGIEHLPPGRWPSDAAHSLALSQQFAVNRALGDLGAGAGLMGVNGPPGTGKTTMLRDVLAGNVVERARRLARLRRPSDAFTAATHSWTDGDGHRRIVRQLRPELTGFEMVVASANNAAVENVTVEIPSEKAIAVPWRGSADYFGALATEVLAAASEQTNQTEPTKAWGMVAARLGRKQNRSAFHSAFWFDPRTRGRDDVRDGVPRMQTRLKRWQDGTAAFTPWAQARARFAAAEERVQVIKRRRAEAQRKLQRLPRLTADERRAVDTLEQGLVALESVRVRAAQAAAVEQAAIADRDQAQTRLDRHTGLRPGWLETVLSLGGAARRWREQVDPLADALARAEDRHRAAAHAAGQAREGHRRTHLEVSAAHHDLERIRSELQGLRQACAEDEQEFGRAHPASRRGEEARQLRAPWLDAELDGARSDLFIAALQLHEDFFANAAGDMLHGLRAALEVVAGQHPRTLSREQIRAAWQLFFLVVPLISTTFASVSRMFAGLGPEDLGWLLIDEAGQAAPQYAVGAIWRARRVLAVGDPLQLEPVVTLPERAQRAIAHGHGVGPTWIPPRASVQTLADRVTAYGTALEQGEQEVWVSAPLRVHRRCDDPMFTISNQIAYNGLMVQGVQRVLDDPEKPDRFDGPDGPRVARSQWVDEPASTLGSHLQLNQVDRVRNALAYLEGQGVPPSDVIVISPFRIVADQLRALGHDYPGLRAGTIHTAQGREASVVILVLGGDPAKPGVPGIWASTPNLVNVAVSRAQRRLYVIGGRAQWAGFNHFKDMARALES